MGKRVSPGLAVAMLLGFRDTGAQVPRECSPPRLEVGSSGAREGLMLLQPCEELRVPRVIPGERFSPGMLLSLPPRSLPLQTHLEGVDLHSRGKDGYESLDFAACSLILIPSLLTLN